MKSRKRRAPGTVKGHFHLLLITPIILWGCGAGARGPGEMFSAEPCHKLLSAHSLQKAPSAWGSREASGDDTNEQNINHTFGKVNVVSLGCERQRRQPRPCPPGAGFQKFLALLEFAQE